VNTGHEIKCLEGRSGQVFDVAFSPNGKRLASACMHNTAYTVNVWDPATGIVNVIIRNAQNCVAFSPNSELLAVGDWFYAVKVWDVTRGKETPTLNGAHTSSITGITFSPDGRRLASASDNEVKVFDMTTGLEVLTLKGRTDVAFSPDGQRLASISPDGMVVIWEASPAKADPDQSGAKR
jgi:WD40 repeat protein